MIQAHGERSRSRADFGREPISPSSRTPYSCSPQIWKLRERIFWITELEREVAELREREKTWRLASDVARLLAGLHLGLTAKMKELRQ